MSDKLTTIEHQETALMRAEPSVGEMLSAAIKSGTSPKELCDLYERMEARKDAKEFSAAFAALQIAIPTVKAEKVVPTNSGSTKFMYAPFEDIMEQLRPHLIQNGFSVSFSQRLGEQTVTTICTVRHSSGHSQSNEYTVRCGNSQSGNVRDADVGASTVCQREALCDAFNIVRRRADDAKMLGAVITSDQAESLRQRVIKTGSDSVKFLAFAGAESYEEIKTSKLLVLDQYLSKKESGK